MSIVNYPPEEILKPTFGRPNYELIILWILNNNPACSWANLKEKVKPSTLSLYLKRLIEREQVDKFDFNKYRITSKGKERYYELSQAKTRRRRLSYPPKIIMRKRNYDHWILWMVYNNNFLKWADFLAEPLSINQSSLSKNMNLVIEKGYVKKENKEYRITRAGKVQYSQMLQLYDLDRQSILDEESKRIEEITKRTIKFFEKYKIDDDDIKFRFLNNNLKLPFETVKSSVDNVDDFYKILLFLSLNHPDNYPDYISPEKFAKKYGIKKLTLEFHIDRIVDEGIYPIKFFKLEVENEGKYYFQVEEKLERMLNTITEDHITRFTYLHKLYEETSEETRVPTMEKTVDVILNEIIGTLFDEGFKETLREFLPEYIEYLAYKIEKERKLLRTFDKVEGLIWREIQKYGSEAQMASESGETEISYYIDPVILEILEPYFERDVGQVYKKIRKMLENNEYTNSLKAINAALRSNRKNLGLIILKSTILCYMERNKEVIDILEKQVDMKQDFSESPEYIPTFLIFVLSYMTLGEFDKAIDLSEKMVDAYPDSAISHATKALVSGYNYMYEIDPSKIDTDQILEEIETSISLDSSDANKARYLQLKATILLRMNDIEGAIKAINEATDLNPDKFDIQDTKIQILLYTNKYAETMALLDELLVRFPDSEKYIKIKMAYINKNMRKTEVGLDIIEDLIYDYPEDLDILNTKVYFLQYLDRKEEAMETIEELIQKDPDKAMYHDTYGEILMYFENFEKAAEEFQTAVDLEPFGWFAYQTYVKLGICYKELRDYEEAKKYLKMGRDYTNTCSCEYDMKNKWLSIANLFLMEIEQIESEF